MISEAVNWVWHTSRLGCWVTTRFELQAPKCKREEWFELTAVWPGAEVGNSLWQVVARMGLLS